MVKNKSKKKAAQKPACDHQNQDTVSQPETGSTLRLASAPFNVPSDGTISVLTSDGTTFYASKDILNLASPVLKERILASGNTNSTSLTVPCGRFTFDVILRFIYPMSSPVFKDMSECSSSSTLPLFMMNPIYKDATALGMDVVCDTIVNAAKELVSSRWVPRTGEIAVRIYALACALNLDYIYKLHAARAVLHVPLDVDIHEALRSDRVKAEDIQALQDFHARAFEAVHDILRINEEDGFPEGLPDLYASFLSCSQCSQSDSGGNPMRAASAMWWQDYTRRALEVLRYAPLNPAIFGRDFVEGIFQKAKECKECQLIVHWKLYQVMPYLTYEIPHRVGQMGLITPVSQHEAKTDVEEEEEEEEEGSTVVPSTESDENLEAFGGRMESTLLNIDQIMGNFLSERNISDEEATFEDILAAMKSVQF